MPAPFFCAPLLGTNTHLAGPEKKPFSSPAVDVYLKRFWLTFGATPPVLGHQ